MGSDDAPARARPGEQPRPWAVRSGILKLGGFRHFPGCLDKAEQRALVEEVMASAQIAPFYRPVTPWGKPMSVEMTNLGPLGWVSSPRGYGYQPTHPFTGEPWPPIPQRVLALWRRVIDERVMPDACLVNLYRTGARMGLHQDRDEEDFSVPVLSISLGDTAVFRIGGRSRKHVVRSMTLASGDVCILAGQDRLAFHGIAKTLFGDSALVPGGGRLNLTLRRASRRGPD